MYFEANAGQLPSSTRFVGRSDKYLVLISGSDLVFRLSPTGRGSAGTNVRMKWVGGRADPAVAGSEPLPGKSNYLVGNDPSAWKTGIPTCKAVTCRSVYDGIDVRLYSSGQWLEYDVVLEPGVDPDLLRFRIDGSDGVRLDDETGDLVITTSVGELRHRKPAVYQPSSTGKRPVAARYRLHDDGVVSFDVGDRDIAAPLVVDPVVTLVQYAGGSSSDDVAVGTFVDAAGSVFLAGRTQSFDLAPLVGPIDGSFNGFSDAFVAKLDPATGSVAFATYIGGTGDDNPTDIAVDAMGASYVTGWTSSSDFPTTDGAYDRTLGGLDAFAFKISPNGGLLEYSSYVGGSNPDEGLGIAVDLAGQATIVGWTLSSDFETLPGAFDRMKGGAQDGFVAKLNVSGTGLVQATFVGGSGSADVANAVDVTLSGELVVVGATRSADFPTTVGAFDRDLEGNEDDGFVVRFSSDLSTLVYSSFFGGLHTDRVLDISLDALDRATIVGTTNSDNLPVTPGAPQPSYGGGSGTDGFVARLSTSAAALEYGTYLGGTDTDACYRVCHDSSDSIYVVGETRSQLFPTTAGAFDRTRSGVTDGFVAKYFASGAQSYSTLVGGNAEDSAAGVGVTAAGTAVVVGSTSSSDFLVTTSLTGRPADGAECYVTALSADGGTVSFSTLVGGSRGVSGLVHDVADSIVALADGTIAIAGTTAAINFPATPGGFDTGGAFPSDVFVIRLDSTGRELLSSTVFGGGAPEEVTDLALGPDNDLFVVGWTSSGDFPTSPGCFDATHNSLSEQDGFVVRIAVDGTALRYGTFLGSIRPDVVEAIAVDADGFAYVTGWTDGPEFPTTPGAFDTTGQDNRESFVTKLDPGGTALVYSTFLGGSFSDKGHAINLDAAGRAIVAGDTASTDFPVTAGAFQQTKGGDFDVFVTKLNANGSALVFSTFLGGTAFELPSSIAIDGTDNILVVGSSGSTNFPTTSAAYDRSYNGGTSDAFLAALTPNAGGLAYATLYGGSGVDSIASVAVSSSGDTWICGQSDSPDIPLSSNGFDESNDASVDALIASFGSSGSVLAYATIVGGTSFDRLSDLAIDDAGVLTAVGQAYSPEFVTASFGVLDGNDALILRLVPAADTVGLYVPASSVWFERFTNTSGNANRAFSYGAGGLGLLPIAGNWDGVGGDSPGLYDPTSGAFFLRNSNAPGPADVVFTFGAGGADLLPLVGDWNGDGTDTVGVYSRSTGAFFLKDTNAGGDADTVFTFGAGGPGILPMAGDWDANGADSIGLYALSDGAFFLHNDNAGGDADIVFTFGAGGPGVTPVVGDWDGDGRDTIGLYLNLSGFFFLRNANSGGAADLTFGFGAGGALPVVANWAG